MKKAVLNCHSSNRQSDAHWDCCKGNVGESSDSHGGAHRHHLEPNCRSKTWCTITAAHMWLSASSRTLFVSRLSLAITRYLHTHAEAYETEVIKPVDNEWTNKLAITTATINTSAWITFLSGCPTLSNTPPWPVWLSHSLTLHLHLSSRPTL